MLLKEIFQFLDCPLKLRYGEDFTPDYDFKSEVFELYVHRCLLHMAKTNSLTAGIAKNQFNNSWRDQKVLGETFNWGSSSVSESLLQINITAVAISNFLSGLGEIISLFDNYILELQTDKLDTIITSVSRSTDGMFHFVFSYRGSQFFSKNENLLIPTILKYIAKSYLKELSDSRYCVHIFKPSVGKFYSFYDDIDMRKVKPIVQNVLYSALSRNQYPNNSVGTCTRCEFKSHCEWKVE